MDRLNKIIEFLSVKRKEVKEERTQMYEKYTNGGYENKYEYWNRLNELKGYQQALKHITQFVRFQIKDIEYDEYLTDDFDFIPMDNE